MSQCFTSPNHWGFNLRQILGGDVKPIPKKGHLPSPEIGTLTLWQADPMTPPGCGPLAYHTMQFWVNIMSELAL